MTPASLLIAEARKLIGVPWRHEGRTQQGVDCIGLVILSGLNAGVDFFEEIGIAPIGVYQRKPAPELIRLVATHCKPTTAEPGALVVFKFGCDSYPRHFGLLTDAGTVIHAEQKTRKRVIEHGYRSHWLRWTDSVWRLPGVEYP